jgi:polyhydroxybutyrate depolymerase
MFHGISSSPTDVEAKAHLQSQPGRFLIAYPYGIGSMKAFNGAGCCDRNGPDDVAFAKEIVLELEALGCSQRHNAFVSGFSNGGFMSHRVGCEAGYRDDGQPWFRAMAPHSGLLGSYDSTPNPCASTQKIPILSFHGAQDPTVAITGANPNPWSPAKWQSFSSTRDSWAAHNECTDPVEVTRTSTTTCTTYTCPAGSSVEFCLSDSLKHNWMGNENVNDYDATSAIFDFFTANMM